MFTLLFCFSRLFVVALIISVSNIQLQIAEDKYLVYNMKVNNFDICVYVI